MIDLAQIDNDTLMARGAYSTVRAAHEDAKKRLQMLCGELSSISSQVLRRMQPDNDDVPQSVDELFAAAKKTLAAMDECVELIKSLAPQRASLKELAWGRK